MADGKKTATVAFGISTILSRFNTISGIRTNEESHSGIWPGDTFFQNVAGLLHKKIYWGISGPDGTN